jgi:hypothetical protein
MSNSSKKNVFMLGVNDFNYEKMRSIEHFDDYNIYGVIPPEEAEDAASYDIQEMMDRINGYLDDFDGSIDAIVTYIDFPISLITPVICKRYGVPSASLESVLKCQHKYWSRLEQAKVVPENIPKFRVFDPLEDDYMEQVNLEYPFWIKPVKSVGSYLGFRINNDEQFREKVEVIREQIGRLAGPLDYVMDNYADVPKEVSEIGGQYCIAEQIIGGRQVTLEGYIYNGDVRIHGVVDSIRFPNLSTFSRYEYPSGLPRSVQKRMYDITEDLLHHIGYDNNSFNIEFFWNKAKDKIWLLEVNTRVSQSHSDLFENVDGASNHQITVELGLGNDPHFPRRKGDYKCAAKFFYRCWEDGLVKKAPTEVELEEVQEEIPGVLIVPQAQEGMRLSDMLEKDSYSYELCWIFVGGKDHKDLVRKYREAIKMLPYEIERVED